MIVRRCIYHGKVYILLVHLKYVHVVINSFNFIFQHRKVKNFGIFLMEKSILDLLPRYIMLYILIFMLSSRHTYMYRAVAASMVGTVSTRPLFKSNSFNLFTFLIIMDIFYEKQSLKTGPLKN